jgi:hypothetical protein
MSELAPGSLSLDDTYESQVQPEAPPPAPEATATTEQTPPVQEDPEPEGTVEIPQGKVVPLAALQGERAAKREADAARQRAEAEANDLKQKLGAIQNEWNQVQPLIQQLRAGQIPPQLQPKDPPPPSAGPLSEQEAIEYARDLDLFKPDGTPDTARAQRLASRQAAISQKSAQAEVQPLKELTAQQRSNAYFQHYANMKDKAGQPIVDPQILLDVWRWAPAELSSQEKVAQVLFNQAVAQSVMNGKYRGFAVQAATPPPPPVHSEGLGGGAPGKTEPTAFDRRAMEAANLSQKDYTEIASRFKPGERNSLE